MKLFENFWNKNKISKEYIDLLESLRFQRITKCQECDVFFSSTFSKKLITYNFKFSHYSDDFGTSPVETYLCNRCKKPYDTVIIYENGIKEYTKTSEARTFKCDENGNEIK